jgi:hypothetical protein
MARISFGACGPFSFGATVPALRAWDGAWDGAWDDNEPACFPVSHVTIYISVPSVPSRS